MQKILLKSNFQFSFTELFPLHNFITKPNFILFKLSTFSERNDDSPALSEWCIKWLLEKSCVLHVHSFLHSLAQHFLLMSHQMLKQLSIWPLKLKFCKKIKIFDTSFFPCNSEKVFWSKKETKQPMGVKRNLSTQVQSLGRYEVKLLKL